MNTCVFCQTSTDLNTELTIKLDDGNKISVLVCDEHSDKSPREAKEAYLKSKTQIDELLNQLKAFGITVNTLPGQKLAVATQTSPVVAPKQQAVSQDDQPDPIKSIAKTFERALPTSVVDKAKTITSISNAGIGVEGHSAYGLDKIRQTIGEDVLDGVVQVDTVEGRAGAPIQIPSKRVDKTGMTKITIQKTTDAQLQRRFKEYAEGDVNFKSGYNLNFRTCPICHGSTTIRSNGQVVMCTKCNGSGEISV